MKIYLKEVIREIYIDYAGRLAKKIKDNLLDLAERNPDVTDYDETLHIHEKIAHSVLEQLKEYFPDSIVQLQFIPDLDENEVPTRQGMAKFRIDWA